MPAAWPDKRKLLFGLLGLILVSGIVVLNLTRKEKRTRLAKNAATVSVKRGAVIERLKETGRIEFVRTVEVKSTVSGEIVHLVAEAGDLVKEGEMLAIIEPDPNQTLQLYNKRAAVDQAQIDLEQNQRGLARKELLLEHRLISKEEVERARDAFEKSENAYRLARLELDIVEARTNIRRTNGASREKEDQKLDDVRLLSPVSGIVITRPVEVGEVVVSGTLSTVTGTKMFEIGDPSQMIVKANISEVDVGRLRPGQRVNIVVDAYPDATYRGEIHRIAPVGEFLQGSNIITFRTEIRILDRELRLRQGMSCDIDVTLVEHDAVLYLPTEAVYEHFGEAESAGDKKGRHGRFLVYEKEEAFIEKEIQIGLKSASRLEILSGLALDDQVAADAEKIYKETAED